MPPLVRMRWGARGGAENFLFGARDQPRAPPTMHQTIRRVRTRTHGPEAKIKTEAHQSQETQVQGKKTIRRVRARTRGPEAKTKRKRVRAKRPRHKERKRYDESAQIRAVPKQKCPTSLRKYARPLKTESKTREAPEKQNAKRRKSPIAKRERPKSKIMSIRRGVFRTTKPKQRTGEAKANHRSARKKLVFFV